MPLDRPTAVELLDAVNEFLLQPQTASSSFHARVASNVVQILKREWQWGAAAQLAEQKRLEALLGRKGDASELHQTLCSAIQNGDFDWTNQALMQHLRKSVIDKLKIDNPKYLPSEN